MSTTPSAMPTLPRSRGTALHRQIFVVLRERIVTGRYAAGAVLPREEDLCEHFGVSRITARRALADLEAQGFVQRRQGIGTFVREDLPVARAAATLSFVDALHKSATDTKVEVLGVHIENVPASIAAQLQLAPDEPAVHALRLRKTGNVTLMVSDAWVPARFSKQVTASRLKKEALYEILMNQGVEFGRVIQEVTAVAADPTFAHWLGTDVGMPLLRVTRIVYDVSLEPVQHLTLTVSPEHSRIVTDLPVDKINTLGTGQIVHDVQPEELKRSKRRGV
ncbi:GntR family transcriptional regulator [Paraburkholderia megapolitana]|uniref:Transcriptional regulator, GntR family n=1 Tax=Paraburkholderia megapolitana TaxID=420953 RepID=A0A1I3L8P6_9BURK|nr:GntR family transcriptional regulator [Paraburkholderia megapolitana]QDQ80609.1 GntR family transcriptional regulator [Paraburkholderia megapolitana]SFI81091.1 transcriptional regulator, GntR family [Paraburkholderia megapolitana]